MNQRLRDIMSSERFIRHLRAGLPYAFEQADAEHSRHRRDSGKVSVGPEVGITRERILLGLLYDQLGPASISLPESGRSGQNVLVDGRPLDIKTVSGNGKVKAKWTADDASAKSAIDEFVFQADMLLVRIYWGQEQDSVFYISRETLSALAREQASGYLTSSRGTNNRGIEFDQAFLRQAEVHPDTLRIAINWRKSGKTMPDPIQRWIDYWTRGDFPVPEPNRGQPPNTGRFPLRAAASPAPGIPLPPASPFPNLC